MHDLFGGHVGCKKAAYNGKAHYKIFFAQLRIPVNLDKKWYDDQPILKYKIKS